MEEVRAIYAEAGLQAQRGMAAESWIAMLFGREE
jgi:hypothetical protein